MMLIVQTAIYQHLAADANIIVPVYDDVPQDSPFPYITIGEDSFNYLDTDTENFNDVAITIHVWSREQGRKECKTIQDTIYNSLHRSNLVQAGYNFVTITQSDAQSFYDADGITRHGVQTFKLLIEEI